VRANSLRQLLRSGRTTIGTHLFLCDPTVVETVGQTAAFDYVELLAEYAAYDLRGLDEFCRAAELHGLGTMIKVDFANNRFVAQRSVGAGFESVLFADARTADDVQQCVRAVKPDTPEHQGMYGAAARRHAMPEYGGTQAYIDALDDVVVAVMIEKAAAVDNLEEILQVPGIDLVQWGASDYVMSVGRPGDEFHPEVRDVERRVIDACQRAGVAFRAEINAPEEADYYTALGVGHFSIGYDLSTIHDVLKDAGARLRDALPRESGEIPET
jgi:2-keto-3-deoxy-L-rhamnonate aldolase RhmA